MSALANLEPGEHRLECPECSRGPRDHTFGVTVEYGRGVAHCFRCGYVETFHDDRVERRPGRPVQGTVGAPKRESLSAYGFALWRACRPVSGPAQAYLEARGCYIPPADGDLRWHPDLKHSDDYAGPALVGLITDAADHRKVLSLHFTWVRPDGTKADVTPSRRYLGGHGKAGGVVRLWPDECVAYSLGIAEGIETALSLAHYHAPAWACLDAGNMGTFPLLAGIEQLVVAVDHDDTGRAAAAACASRWLAAGRHVQAVGARRPGADLNDAIARARHEA